MQLINLYKQAKAFFLRNRVSDFEYDCVRREVYITNRSVLTVCSFVAALLFLLLTVAALILNDSDVLESYVVYGIFFLLTLSVYCACRLVPEEKNQWSVVQLYSFYIMISLFTIINGVFNRADNYAVIFFVFEFGFPLIFVDKIKRMYSINILLIIIFCISTVIVKEPKNYKVDIFYSLIFCFLSFLPSFYLTKVRVREFSLRQLIESERDTDALTGLLNKSAFVRETKKNIATTKNGILIIMDLDYFKNINDTYGHFTGDNVLKLVSACIQQTFRSSDVMGRFGGDEFVILMAKTENLEMAMFRCNQLLEKLNSTKIFPNDPSNKTVIHASMGFALYKEQPDFDSLFKNADTALYEAKNNGKDRACQFSL